MYNPNSNCQMMESVACDLNYLGLIVTDVIERPEWVSFTVGNESIQFAVVTFINGKCKVRADGREVTVNYKGSLEQLSQDVAAKVVKAALSHRNRSSLDHDEGQRP